MTANQDTLYFDSVALATRVNFKGSPINVAGEILDNALL